MDIYGTYEWVVLLKDKNGTRITEAPQKILH